MKITRRTEQEINISELKAAIKEGRGLEWHRSGPCFRVGAALLDP